MSMIGRIYILIFLVASSVGKHATDNSGDDRLPGSANDHLIGASNAQNIKELKANVYSLWTEINGIKQWTQQHEKRVHHNYESYGYHGLNFGSHGHDFGYHAPDGHSSCYGGHYSHWHPGMFPPRVWYHYNDIVSDRSHHIPIHSKNAQEYLPQQKKSDDSSEEEEEEEEEYDEKKKEKKEGKKKNKEKKEEEKEVKEEKELKEEEEEEEEEKKVEEKEKKRDEEEEEEEVKNGKVEEKEEELKYDGVEEKEEEEEVTNGVVKEIKNAKDEEVEEGGEKEEEIKVKEGKKLEGKKVEGKTVEEQKVEEEEEEEEEDVKPRGRYFFGSKKKARDGRKGHKNTLFHNIKSHLNSKKHPIAHAKKLDENEIISKAFCDLAPNVEIPESKVTGNVTIFQKRNSKGPLYFHVNLQGFRNGEDEASRTHGFHIHVDPLSKVGHCNSTGPHFNPMGKFHGSLHTDIRHLGDFGNIVVDKNGRLEQFIFVDSTNTLEGENSIISKSIDVHENPDDLGKGVDAESLRSGNAGPKLACCTIHTLADALTKLNG